MRRILPLLIMFAMVFFLQDLFFMSEAHSIIKTTVALGFLMLSSYLVGHIFLRFHMPGLTGYIFCGILMGPFAFNLLDYQDVKNLKFIDDLAIAFIAFLAGAELRLTSILQRKRTYGLLISLSIAVVFTGITGLIIILRHRIPIIAQSSLLESLMIASILGVIALARSPSSAIAIITETKAKGKLSETVLGVAVGLDILVIILFTVVMSISRSVLLEDGDFRFEDIFLVCSEIAGSLILGSFFGIGITYALKYYQEDLAVLVLGMGFFVTKFCHWLYELLDSMQEISFHLEPILMCMAAGFAVQNLSRYGPRFLETLSSASLPIYVVFFSIAGASIQVSIFFKTLWLTIIIVVCRAVFLFMSTSIGGKLAGESPLFNRYCWMGLITQAGVSIGLMNEVIRWFPDWKPLVSTVVVGTISLNQIVGPILFKHAIIKSGEHRR